MWDLSSDSHGTHLPPGVQAGAVSVAVVAVSVVDMIILVLMVDFDGSVVR